MKRIIGIGFAIGLVWGIAYSALPTPHLTHRHWTLGATAALAGHPPPTFSATLACSPAVFSSHPGTTTCTETPSNCSSGDSAISAVDWGEGAGLQGVVPATSQQHTYNNAGSYTVEAQVYCTPVCSNLQGPPCNVSVDPTTSVALH